MGVRMLRGYSSCVKAGCSCVTHWSLCSRCSLLVYLVAASWTNLVIIDEIVLFALDGNLSLIYDRRVLLLLQI